MSKVEWLNVQLSAPEIARVFSHIVVDEAGCWNWTAETVDGYPRWRYRGRKELVHRVMFAWAVGPLRRGHGHGLPELDHVVCNKRGCCNPAHVELTSHRQNTLRSAGPTAENARKTHCGRGHVLPTHPNGRLGRGLPLTKRYCPSCASLHA